MIKGNSVRTEIEVIKLLIINNKELVLLWEKPIQHAIQIKVKHINSEELGNINMINTGTKIVQVEGKNWGKGFIIEQILQKIVLDFEEFTDAINFPSTGEYESILSPLVLNHLLPKEAPLLISSISN